MSTSSMARCAPATPVASRVTSRPAACASRAPHVASNTRTVRRRRGVAVTVTALGGKNDSSRFTENFVGDKTPRGMGFFAEDSKTTSSSISLLSTPLMATIAPLFLLAQGSLAEDIKPSYFASLGLFMLSAPGLWSLVKRSAKSKVGRKTFEVGGPAAADSMPLDELAREVSMFFKRNNYNIKEAGEVITFEGNIAPEKGTAAYITFCVAVGLLCIGLVCSIALPGGNLWYAMALVSPLSGTYYMNNAERKEEMKVKMVTADDDLTVDIVVEGDVEEIERFRRELNLIEKGMVYVKGVLEK
jgi:hypothetical protein